MRARAALAAAVLALAGAAALGRPADAAACSCARASGERQLADAAVVFAGVAVRRGPVAPAAPIVPGGWSWTFRVEGSLKGRAGARQAVVTADGPAACGIAFEPGRRYLVLASRLGGRLVTGLCAGTRPLALGGPLWWPGRVVGRRPLTAVAGEGSVLRLVYGRCRARDDEGCSPPLQVQTARTCPNPGVAVRPLRGRRVLRGVPAGARGGGLVLLTGRQQVRLFGRAALRAAAVGALTAIGGPPRLARPGAALPAPVPGAGRRVTCPAPRRELCAG